MDEENLIKEPITLMLLGSGMRFPAFIGAISALEEKGLKINRIVGASAGSIIGSAYAIGKTPIEMKKMAMEVDTQIFKDLSILSILRGKGLYKGDAVEEWVDNMLGGRRFKDDFKIPPYVIATDILSNSPFIFSRANFPDMKVSRAIRFSIGIPWVFEYKHFSSNGKKHVFVDGNFVSGIIEEMFDLLGQNKKTLVLRVVSTKLKTAPFKGHFNTKKYLEGLLNTMMHTVEKERINARRWKDTILIFCGDIPPTKFSITPDERLYLFEQGYMQVKKFLEYKWGI